MYDVNRGARDNCPLDEPMIAAARLYIVCGDASAEITVWVLTPAIHADVWPANGLGLQQ